MKNRLIIISLLLAVAISASATAANPDAEEYAARGKELFALERWSDARHEFNRSRELLTADDRVLLSSVDYHLAICAMELEEVDAEARMLSYLETYRSSVYLNDVRFALAVVACKKSDFKRAESYFSQVNYKSLSNDLRSEFDMRMGYIAFLHKRYDEAIKHFDRVPLSSSYIHHATYYRAYIAYSTGDYEKARMGFRALEGHDPYSRLVPFYLLQMEFDDGNYKYVVTNGDQLIEHAAEKSRADLERIMAESWFHLENYPRATEYMSRYERRGGTMGRNENYIMGYSLYRSTRYAEAAISLRKVCGADDRLTQNASYHLADCLLRQGDKHSAMQSFAMAANEEYDRTIAEDALFNYGKLQYELGGGMFNGAINVLSRYIATYPSSPRVSDARELLIAAYYNSSDYDAAYEAIKQQPSPDGNERAALQKITYFRGLKAFAEGDLDAASANFAESAQVAVSPKYNALVLFWQGEIAYLKGNFATARVKYTAYLNRAPRTEREYAMAHYNIGYSHFTEGDMNSAGKSFNRFITLYTPSDDYRADAFSRVGDVHYSARRFAEAESAYAKAAAVGTRSSDYARYQRAIVLGLQGKTSAKIDALKVVVDGRKGGDYADDSTYELGRTYLAQEQYQNGAEALELLIERYPSSPFKLQAMSDLGLAYQNLGDNDLSLACYDKVIKESPSSPQAKNAMQGVRDIYVARGEVDAYFDYAEKSGVETDTSRVARDSLTFASAQKMYIDGKIEQATKSLDAYVVSFPKGYYVDEALFYLSDCYLRAGNNDLAILSLSTLAERPRSQYTERVLDKLSTLCYEQREYASAAKAYRALSEIVEADEAKTSALEGYVRATIESADEEAIVAMSDYVATRTTEGKAWREARYAHASILISRGERSDAMALYEELSRDPKSREGAEAAYHIIVAAFESKQYDKAEKLIFALADSETQQSFWLAKSFIVLGDIYVVRGDTFQARATYQSVADGYSPLDDGVVDEARMRIASLK